MQLPFYFDYACPWAYMANLRVEPYFRDLGVEIDFRPVNLVKLKEPAAGSTPEMGDRKKANYVKDFIHWAEFTGADLAKDVRTAPRPDTRLLLKAALVAKDDGRFRELHYPAYRARWAEADDVADPAVVSALVAAAGLDVNSVMDRAQSAELAERLQKDTDAAIARGVFGVPTVFVGDEMFFGNDRFEMVRYFIEKQR